jgi:nitrogen regulatory protein A
MLSGKGEYVVGQREEIEAKLHQLRNETSADFVALALPDGKNRLLWKYGSGNRYDRYKRIVTRTGKGFVGKAIMSRCPVIYHAFAPRSGDDPSNYPILLAENLTSAVIVPFGPAGQGVGVLLAGCREDRQLTSEAILRIIAEAGELANPSYRLFM